MQSRIVAVFISLALLVSLALPAEASEPAKQGRYDAAISRLEAYMTGDPQAKLNDIITAFDGLGFYGMSMQLSYYALVLKQIEENDFSLVFRLIENLQADAEFAAFLEERKSLGALGNLEQYAHARQAEMNSDLKAAVEGYAKCVGFLDSAERSGVLIENSFVKKYQEALRLYNEDTYAGYRQAYALFVELGDYELSAVYAQKADILRQTPVPSATPTPTPTPTPTQKPTPTPTPSPTPKPTPKPTPASAEEAQYQEAKALSAAGKYAHAALVFHSLQNYRDSDAREKAAWEQNTLLQRRTVIDAFRSSIGIMKNGQIRNNYTHDLSSWHDIVSVTAGDSHVVGLKADGTVVAVGSNNFGECDVSDWENIVATDASLFHTVGLKADGTVVAAGLNNRGQCDTGGWKDIVAIASGFFYTIGLKADGTVVATRDPLTDIPTGAVSAWEDIVTIDSSIDHIVALKSDGTVVVAGRNSNGECNTSGWENIVAVSAGYYHTLGLKADGTVVAAGLNDYHQCEVSGWRDIAFIKAGTNKSLGIKEDGSLVASGEYAQMHMEQFGDLASHGKSSQ